MESNNYNYVKTSLEIQNQKQKINQKDYNCDNCCDYYFCFCWYYDCDDCGNCGDCGDCVNCGNCGDCGDCVNCSDCGDCGDCGDCVNCRDCGVL